MKPPPSCLPAANSAKWHSRRVWDSLGYLRVRTLANPHWRRDLDWLQHVLELERPPGPGPDRDLIDAAIGATRGYRDLRRRQLESDVDFDARAEEEWDRILSPIDDYLERRQRRHLEAVREAGASGLPMHPDA